MAVGKANKLGESSGLALGKAQTLHLGVSDRCRNIGLRTMMVEAGWFQLTLLVFALYLAAGAAVGVVAYMCASNVGNTEAIERAEDSNQVFFWWYCGFWLLLLSSQYQPKAFVEYLVCFTAPILGSMITLMLFGVVYEKFAQRRSSIVIAKIATLRRGGEDHGGHVVLTFRYAHTRGFHLVNVNIYACALVRELMPDGDHLIVQREIQIYHKSGMLPPAHYLHHVISLGSPFYDPKSPTSCSFKNIISIIVGVTGTSYKNQEDHSGCQNLELDSIVCDARFKKMLGGRPGRSLSVDFDAFLALEDSDCPKEMRVLSPGMSYASLGLPQRNDEQTILPDALVPTNVAQASDKQTISNETVSRKISL